MNVRKTKEVVLMDVKTLMVIMNVHVQKVTRWEKTRRHAWVIGISIENRLKIYKFVCDSN